MRYIDATQQPSPPFEEGDRTFVGMEMKRDRSEVPPTFYTNLINGRSATGIITKRRGTAMPTFANVIAFSAILGSGLFSNPNGVQLLLIVTPSAVYGIRDYNYPVAIKIPAGMTLSGNCEVSQQGHTVFVHAPSVPAQLVWDGVSEDGFQIATKSDPGVAFTSTLPPQTAWSVNLGDRAVISPAADQISASDELDYTTFDLTPTGPNFRTNTGSADPIVGVYPYAQQSLIVGKQNSFDLFVNFVGDFSTTSREDLSTTIGVWARKTGVMVGGDLFFLNNPGGVYQISQVIQDRLVAVPVPVSDSIEPLIKRINWSAASKATACVSGYYYFLAVPIDGSTVNNAVLVYNTVSKNWEAYDTWGGAISIDDLWITDFQGAKRVFAVDKIAKAVYVLYEGKTDVLASGQYEVTMTFESRGYALVPSLGYLFDYRGAAELSPNDRPGLRKHYNNVSVPIATWRPSISVTQVMDGAGDERALNATPVTKDRTKYDIAFKADYVPDNSNNDFDAPGRQDYSVPDGVYLQAGINIEKKQESSLRFSLKSQGRYSSFRLVNTQGECDIKGMLVETTPVQQIRRAA